jgi:alpha-glucosidase
LLTLRGTPFLYYGEEIGMRDTKIPRSRLQDPIGKRYWPFNPGRDPARSPMQWNETPNAGFTTGEPWLPVNKNFREINMAAQEEKEHSLLNWYRRLLRVRRSQRALQQGSYHPHAGAKDVLVYERRLGDERNLVLLNFANSKQSVSIPADNGWRVLIEYPNQPDTLLAGPVVDLEPYAVIIAKPFSKG